MAKKRKTTSVTETSGAYIRIREILESARASVARSVNTTQVVANWLIGGEIVEEEQSGKRRAGYGDELIIAIAERLTADFGKGFSKDNLFWFRRFYLGYPSLIDQKFDALRQISPKEGGLGETTLISHALRDQPHQPGKLHPNLSWTHYRTLLRVESSDARAFYEIETIQNNWSARELERQINSLLYERLAMSKDKKGLMRLATKGQEIATPIDVFKDPVVIEFLGLPESPRLVESDLETALTNNLQTFLLELGKGFAFVSRQEQITLDGDHFCIDLVFYHTILKCYILIDLKVDKLTHADLGQLQLYVNYYDQHRCTPGDNPTLGLILCTDKNDTVGKYALGPKQSKKIFASRYKLHLPSEAELQDEIRREVRQLTAGKPVGKPRRKKRLLVVVAISLSTNTDADDVAQLRELFAPAVEQGCVVTIPPGDYQLDGANPIRIPSDTTVMAYGAKFHLPEALGDQARVVLFSGENVRNFNWFGGHFAGHV